MHDYENKGVVSLCTGKNTGDNYFGFTVPEVDPSLVA
jgi:hypothetical protein